MRRNSHIRLIGILCGFIAYSFLGCFVTRTTEKGQCEDDGNPCTIDSCESGGTLHIFAPAGSLCSLGENGGTCNDMGVCVLACENQASGCSCSADSQCPADKPCIHSVCTDGTCLLMFATNGTPAGIPTADECQQMVCQAGTAVSAAADLGTTCATGVCDSNGMCVDCLSMSDWTACGGATCPVKLCNGETSMDAATCKSGFVADGVCCDTACTEVCKSCNTSGADKGTCSNIAYYQPDPSYVPQSGGSATSCDPTVAGGFCDGTGKCLKVSGTQCQIGENCISGSCSGAMKCLGAPGEVCFSNAECVSMMCMQGACK